MTFIGHLILSCTPAAVYADHVGVEVNVQSVLQASVIMFFTLLPDIDEPNSYIGRRMRRVAGFMMMIGIEHRTLTHWLIVPFLLTAYAMWLLPVDDAKWVYLACYGMFMHGIGDLMTSGGIRGYYWPLFSRKTVRLLPGYLSFATGSWREWVVILLIFASGLFMLIDGLSWFQVG